MINSKLCMIPGPTPVARSIQNQMGRETISFKDTNFVNDFISVVNDLEVLWGAEQAFVIAGSGTLAMEMAIANTLQDDDRCLVISHGYFGDRFIDMLERRHIHVDILQSAWGDIVPLETISEQLKTNDYKAVIATHIDTSTGVVANISKIGSFVAEHENTLFIVDGVCSTAAVKEHLESMKIDVLLSASQKAFGVAPGLALVWASKKALERRKQLQNVRDSYIDFFKWQPIMDDPMKYWGTPPVNLIWALKQSLTLIKEEGLEYRFQRHVKDAKAIQQALQAIGFDILANEHHRAATLTNVVYPEGVPDVEFRQELARQGVVVAGGIGQTAGKLFRLGHMGNIDTHIITSTLNAIERTLAQFIDIDYGVAVKTYMDNR